MEAIAVIILAAGQGKRMGSDLPKVLAQTSESPLIVHVLSTAAALDPAKIVIVTGHKRELVEEAVRTNAGPATYSADRVVFAVQQEQRGTGDAVKSALPALKGFTGTVLILYGDVPLIRPETLQTLLAVHRRDKATVSLISFITDQPAQYGRVVRDSKRGHVNKIVEARDCSPAELLINEANSGIYAVDSAFLVPAIDGLKNDNAQGEFYLTDIIERAVKEGQTIGAVALHGEEEVQGVNTRRDLASVDEVLNVRRVRALIDSGVTVADPRTLWIDSTVKVSAGARIGPVVQLRGKTEIAADAEIEGSAFLRDCIVGPGAWIKFSVRAEGAHIGPHAMVGPFAHLRPGTELGESVKIGNFVETKKAVLARGAKASHLTYLGDCRLGEGVNVGAGTITCNYDGYEKFETVIEDGAFIGSNSALVAPLTIGAGATVGAGSTVAQDVPADALAVNRAPLRIHDGWSKAKRENAKIK